MNDSNALDIFSASAHRVLSFLIVAALLLCLFNLGARALWTQEGRWALICWHMLRTHEYWRPMLAGVPYFDKPLLSYWLITFLSHVIGLNTWSLRLPSALSGLATLFAVYRIGCAQDRLQGVVSASLLLTTFYFVFWVRVASADMLNVAGIYLAYQFYLSAPAQARFKHYAACFLTMALASLCKGLVAPVCTVLLILPHLNYETLKAHLKQYAFWSALLLAIGVYTFPFLGSYWWSGQAHQSGLWLVFRENILRYFQPFDHVGHWYTYFIYLPLYTLPWTPFCLLGLAQSLRRGTPTRYRQWARSFCLLFLFFSLSGSRRSYYILPLLPLASLLASAYLVHAQWMKPYLKKSLLSIAILLFMCFGLVLPWPTWNDSLPRFAQAVHAEAVRTKPWQDWSIVSVKALPRTLFYLYPEQAVVLMTPEEFVRHLHLFPTTLQDKLIITRWAVYARLSREDKTRYHVVLEPIWQKNLLYSSKERSVALLPLT